MIFFLLSFSGGLSGPFVRTALYCIIHLGKVSRLVITLVDTGYSRCPGVLDIYRFKVQKSCSEELLVFTFIFHPPRRDLSPVAVPG